ncbi:MAG: hypothetical protein IT539_07445 [Bradyrhizobiaceae bacterium]|nr:hypothetical protein [Bradyrhizobiaceae bacterium]
MMQKLPPHEAIAALFANRCAKWREANPGDDWSAWADSEQIACGKRASCPTTCAEMARLIARMEAELVTDDAAADQSADEGTDDERCVIAKIGGAK